MPDPTASPDAAVPAPRPSSGAPPLRIGLAGLGTVGAGVARLLREDAAAIAARAGRPIVLAAVGARNPDKARGLGLSGCAWTPVGRLAERPDVDAVVEAVGGADGPALPLARAALATGKPLVTANKALVARHGIALAELAERHGATLRFEAAVAGGVPVVRALREGLAGERVRRVHGILNGTSNYILSAMEAGGAEFAATLARAQALGIAEADPRLDIDGVDAGHKLAILAALAFGTRLDADSVRVEGIAALRAADIAHARQLGFAIRLVATADLDGSRDERDGPRLLQRVRPCLVPLGHPLAAVGGATNAVVVEGRHAGRLLFQGAGAGAGPTASAVVADLVEVARGGVAPPFGVPVAGLRRLAPADPAHREGRAFLRFAVADRPGVLAAIAAAMRDGGVSIESLLQLGRAADGGEVLVALVTHRGPERCVTAACSLLAGSPDLLAEPLVLPLLED